MGHTVVDTSVRAAGSSDTAEITSQDLLERYRGLVASGRLKWDDEQVRTIMKVRRRPRVD